MAVAILDAPWKAAAVLGSYILIQNLSYLITPSVMYHQVKLLLARPWPPSSFSPWCSD